MPDSLLPIQRPASQRERDLDALLSGEAGYPTVVLGPVAAVLAALRAAPGPGELDGEAAARAAFRLFLPHEAGVSGGAPALAPLRQEAGTGQRGPVRQGSPARPPQTMRGGPRHRRPRRRAPRHGRWQVMAVACGAAAVVIVGGIALAGVFSGGNGHPGVLGSSSGATSAAPQATSPGSNGVEGTASKAPTPTPTPSHSAGQSSGGASASPGPSELCRQYLESIGHPGSRSDRAAARDDLQRLSDLAGGPWHVLGYCLQLQPWAMTPDRSASDPDGLGFPVGSQDAGGAGGSQDQGGPGQQPGNAGDGNQR